MSGSEGPQAESALRFSGVSAVRGRTLVWADATFEVPVGGVVAVIGPNGSGKTTLLQVILGLLPAAAGQVRVFGGPPRVGATVGYVPQNSNSVAAEGIRAVDAVLLGLTGQRWAFGRASDAELNRVQQILKAVGAHTFMNARLASLSGGQRQRVAIAEALAAFPRMLVLDEPLAALDLRSQREIVTLLARVHAASGITIVVVAHDLNPLLPILDSAICIRGGRPQYAPIADVLDDGLLSELYETPVEVVGTPDGPRFVRSAL